MKKMVIAIFATVACAVFPVASVMAWENPICNNPEIRNDPIAYENAGCATTETIFDKASGAVTAVFSVVGVLAVGTIIFGGIRYMISQGDPGKIKKAKDTIMYAVIGLIVTLLAFSITMFIMGALS